jgi:hypothetical protein
MVVVS